MSITHSDSYRPLLECQDIDVKETRSVVESNPISEILYVGQYHTVVSSGTDEVVKAS